MIPGTRELARRGAGEAEDATVVTWEGAADRCAELGARLCTPSELRDTPNGGCGFDYEFLATKLLRDTDTFGFRRPRAFSGTGTCASNPYFGEYYEAAYDANDTCDAMFLALDEDNHVDGFLCCL